jgi:hypothetical protein
MRLRRGHPNSHASEIAAVEAGLGVAASAASFSVLAEYTVTCPE